MPQFHPLRPTPFCYGIYCYLSLLAVATYQAISSNPVHEVLFFLLGPVAANLFVQMTYVYHRERYPERASHISAQEPSNLYTISIAAILVACGHFAQFMQQHYAIKSTRPDIQLYALHFTFAYFILSQCENHRLCVPGEKRTLLAASDACCWDIKIPVGESFWRDLFSFKKMFLLYISYIGHMLVTYGAIWTIKCALFPDADVPLDKSFPSWLRVDHLWISFFETVIILRPVRILSRMLFWAFVDATGLRIEREVYEKEGYSA